MTASESYFGICWNDINWPKQAFFLSISLVPLVESEPWHLGRTFESFVSVPEDRGCCGKISGHLKIEHIMKIMEFVAQSSREIS